MAPELKLGQDLRLRQQLVMTPQLQQAIKILQLSLPELEAVVQNITPTSFRPHEAFSPPRTLPVIGRGSV